MPDSWIFARTGGEQSRASCLRCRCWPTWRAGLSGAANARPGSADHSTEPVKDFPAARTAADLDAASDLVAGSSAPPRTGDLKWFEPKTIYPLIAVRDREER
jgi:hypothetical protein